MTPGHVFQKEWVYGFDEIDMTHSQYQEAKTRNSLVNLSVNYIYIL